MLNLDTLLMVLNYLRADSAKTSAPCQFSASRGGNWCIILNFGFGLVWCALLRLFVIQNGEEAGEIPFLPFLTKPVYKNNDFFGKNTLSIVVFLKSGE